MFKSFTMRDWAIFVQNYGQPLRLGRYGPEASAEDLGVLWEAVANIAGDCAAIVPRGMEIEFIEAKSASEGSELYERRSDWLDRQISKLVLGQTTTTDAVSGGHAVAKEHRLVQEDIERADARMLTMSLTRQLAQTIIAFNFGPQAKYPTIRIGRPDEVPLATVIDGLQKLGPLGLRVEASQVRDRMGFAEPAPDAEVIGGRVPPPVVAPPAPPAPALQSSLGRLASLHTSQPEADVMQALTDRLALDAQGALGGMVGAIEAELNASTDLADFGRRLAALQLDPTALAEVLGRSMAIAHLAGQASVLDELQGG
jgi:phage gp29-like protein